MKKTHDEYIRRVWQEAEEEVSKVHPGKCATCGGAGVVLPHMEVRDAQGNRREIPLDKDSPLYRGPGLIRGHLVCSCCSFSGCQHKSARQLQVERDREIEVEKVQAWARAKRKEHGWTDAPDVREGEGREK